MSELTTQQMIDAIRKGDKLGHKAMQEIANKLEELKEIEEFKADKSRCGLVCKNSAGYCHSCNGDKFIGPWDARFKGARR